MVDLRWMELGKKHTCVRRRRTTTSTRQKNGSPCALPCERIDNVLPTPYLTDIPTKKTKTKTSFLYFAQILSCGTLASVFTCNGGNTDFPHRWHPQWSILLPNGNQGGTTLVPRRFSPASFRTLNSTHYGVVPVTLVIDYLLNY